MKKLLIAIIAAGSLMVAGSALADDWSAGAAGNFQIQSQDLDVTPTTSTIAQDQFGVGGSVATPGAYGEEGQIQAEGFHIGGTVSTGGYHQYDVDSITYGESGAEPGIAGHAEANTVKGGIYTNNDGVGTAAVAGSAMSVESESVAGAFGLAGASAGTEVYYSSKYIQENTGAGTYQAQVGAQESVVKTGTVAVLIGGADATASTYQVGGTALDNSTNGLGTQKAAGVAYSEASTTTATAGIAGAGASATSEQVHAGYQESFGAGTYQVQGNYVASGASATN